MIIPAKMKFENSQHQSDNLKKTIIIEYNKKNI
jgi:hypothetical protein